MLFIKESINSNIYMREVIVHVNLNYLATSSGINSGLCGLVCSPPSFLIDLSTIMAQLNVTLIHLGFRRLMVCTIN